jgi:hypothetical protein
MNKNFIVSVLAVLVMALMSGLSYAGDCCGGSGSEGTCAMDKTADMQCKATNAADVKPAKSKEAKTKKTAVSQSYQCPMHPEVISDKPGNCPKCGMKLIKMDITKKSK